MSETNEGVVRVHRAVEACSLAVAHLAVAKNLKPGYGISMKNHKKVLDAYRVLNAVTNKLTTVSNNWLR